MADLPFLVPSRTGSGSKVAKPRSRQRGQAQAVRREGKIKPVSRRDPCWLRQLRRFWLARRRRTDAGIAAKNTEGRKKAGSSANDRANAKLGPLFLSSFRFLRLPLSGAWRIFLSSSLHCDAAEAKPRSRQRGQAQAVRREGKIKPVARRDPCWLRQLRRFWLARRRRTEAGIAAKNTKRPKKAGSSANGRANAKQGPLFLSSFRFLRLSASQSRCWAWNCLT